jgi:hypothetical protein
MFEPTDIVPLVNIAFPKRFGTKKNVQKAVLERGQNPINYNILMTIPCSEKDVVYLTAEAESQAIVTNATIKPLPTFNIDRGIGSYYLNCLVCPNDLTITDLMLLVIAAMNASE